MMKADDQLWEEMGAVTEKVATLRTADYLKERARRGSREKLLEVLAKAPDVEPEVQDRLR